MVLDSVSLHDIRLVQYFESQVTSWTVCTKSQMEMPAVFGVASTVSHIEILWSILWVLRNASLPDTWRTEKYPDTASSSIYRWEAAEQSNISMCCGLHQLPLYFVLNNMQSRNSEHGVNHQLHMDPSKKYHSDVSALEPADQTPVLCIADRSRDIRMCCLPSKLKDSEITLCHWQKITPPIFVPYIIDSTCFMNS